MISYIIWDIDPEIFDGFEFLRWYGVCWAVGIILGYQMVLRIYKAEGIPTVELDKLTVYVMLGAIIGARLGHILFYDPLHYLNNPIEILPIRINPTFQYTGLAGLASHGGILGALIALYLYHRKFKKDYLWMLDRLVIGGALLGAFIRIGNLLNSEIIGVPSQLPWAFMFSQIDQTPRHPAQLYEALFYLIISLSLFLIWRSQKVSNYKGFLFGLGIFLIFSQRFLVEFLKENQVEFEEQLKLNMGQTLSIPLILMGIVIMVWSVTKFCANRIPATKSY
ncbi:prolipoprotein diacylglyceryl transferase [Cytophagales bacterium WSM2-2]|nr:prolipoprotein diacylglyceryl transferase [Cytophagales bacterium WSM2-2]